MELMSSLLLCVLVAVLPQTLGQSEVNGSLESKPHYGSFRPIKKAVHSRVLLDNMYGTPGANKNSDLLDVFSDVNCQNCTNCMARALKEHSAYYHPLKDSSSSEELQEFVLMNQIVEKRFKRDAPKATPKKDSAKTKTTKPKKNKIPKTVSVTKYELNGEVYALKVKETKESDDKNGKKDTCQVFSVKSSLPCESPQTNALLEEARRKFKKADKKVTSKPTTTTPKARLVIYKKRETDNSDMPAEFVASDEDMTDFHVPSFD